MEASLCVSLAPGGRLIRLFTRDRGIWPVNRREGQNTLLLMGVEVGI